MTTNISIMDDGYNVISTPIMGVYALYQQPAVEPTIALGTVEPEPVEDEDAQAEIEAKVVTSPGKSAAKAAAASEDVVTK